MERVKAAAKFHARSRFLRLICKNLNEPASFNDQIGALERNRCGASIGEEFEAANLIQDAGFGGPSQNGAHAVRDDQRALGRLERLDAFKYTDRCAPLREQ
jgi:hypothetical protein